MLDFAVTGLGRCRTAWFAAFLSDGNVHCHHEFAKRCRTPADLSSARVAGRVTGIADTLVWLADEIPAKRVVVIHRDPAFAERFVERTTGAKVDLSVADEALWKVKGLHVFFDELDERMGELVWILTGYDMRPERFELFKAMKIELLDPMAEQVPLSSYWEERLCRHFSSSAA